MCKRWRKSPSRPASRGIGGQIRQILRIRSLTSGWTRKEIPFEMFQSSRLAQPPDTPKPCQPGFTQKATGNGKEFDAARITWRERDATVCFFSHCRQTLLETSQLIYRRWWSARIHSRVVSSFRPITWTSVQHSGAYFPLLHLES